MRFGQDTGHPQVPTTRTNSNSTDAQHPSCTLASHLSTFSNLAERRHIHVAKRSEVPSSQVNRASIASTTSDGEDCDPMAVLMTGRPAMAAAQWPIAMATPGHPWHCGDLAAQLSTTNSTEQYPSVSFSAPVSLLPDSLSARNAVVFPPSALHIPETPSSDIRSAASDPSPPSWQIGHPERPPSTSSQYQFSTHDLPRLEQASNTGCRALDSAHGQDRYQQHHADGQASMQLRGQHHTPDTKVHFPLSSPHTVEQLAAPGLHNAATTPSQVPSQVGLSDALWPGYSPFAFAAGAGSLGLFLSKEEEALIPSFLQSGALTNRSQSGNSARSNAGIAPAVKAGFHLAAETPQLGNSDWRTQAQGQALTPGWTTSANTTPNVHFSRALPHQGKQEANYEKPATDSQADRVAIPLNLQPPSPSPKPFEPEMSAREMLFCSPKRIAQRQGRTGPFGTSHDEQWNIPMPDARPPHRLSGPSDRLQLPEKAGSAAFFLISSEDEILWSTDTFQTCSTLLVGSNGRRSDAGDLLEKQLAEVSGAEHTKFSDLLADEQTVLWWQQACREILLARYQLQQHRQQTPTGDQTPELPLHGSKELVLKWKSRPGDKAVWVEVGVFAPEVRQLVQEGCLFIKLKPVSLPSLATVSSGRMLAGSDVRSGLSSSLLVPGHAHGGMPETAELRLLVSRHGLILRATCPSQSAGVSGTLEPLDQVAEARTLFAILGEGASLPAFGQSLVDIPKLTPLLHVVAQAAIVGLAQTVKLSGGGRQITAVVRPVLRTSQLETAATQRSHLPSAKVWITLSAPLTIMRRPRSSPSMSTTGFSSSFAQFMGLRPPHQHAAPDRRRSVQAYEPRKTSPMLPPNYVPHPDRRASTASIYIHAALAQASTSGQQYFGGFESKPEQYVPPESPAVHKKVQEQPIRAEDSLSHLMAELQEENRKLRQQVEERRHRWRSHVQFQDHSVPQSSNVVSQPVIPHPSVGTPSSCPTKLLYLS